MKFVLLSFSGSVLKSANPLGHCQDSRFLNQCLTEWILWSGWASFWFRKSKNYCVHDPDSLFSHSATSVNSPSRIYSCLCTEIWFVLLESVNCFQSQKWSIPLCDPFLHDGDSLFCHSAGQCLNQWIFQVMTNTDFLLIHCISVFPVKRSEHMTPFDSSQNYRPCCQHTHMHTYTHAAVS